MAGEAYAKRYAGGFVDLPSQTTAIDSLFLNAVETELLRLLGADPIANGVQVWDSGLGRFKTIKLTTNELAPTAGITNAQLAGGIAPSKLAGFPSSSSYFLAGDGSWTLLSSVTGLQSFNGRTAPAVVPTTGDYTAAMVTNAADKSSASTQAFTGAISHPTPATADNSTLSATTAFVKAQGYTTVVGLTSFNGRTTAAAVPTAGDYTAAQVTNAADKSSASAQVFTGVIATGSNPGIGSAAGVHIDPAGYIIVSRNSNVFHVTQSGDATSYRFVIGQNGEHSWAAPPAAADLVMQRATTNPASTHLDINQAVTIVGGVYTGLLQPTYTPSASVPIDYSSYSSYNISIGGTGGGTLTISNDLHPPSASQSGIMYIAIANAPGNTATAISWGGNYVAGGGLTLPTSIAQGVSNKMLFIWTGASWIMMVRTT